MFSSEGLNNLKCSAFIATSLDGFISRLDGSIEWLEKFNSTMPMGEDCGYAHFMGTIDGIVMGRVSFEKVLSFPTWPYANTPVTVLTSDSLVLVKRIPPELSPFVTVSSLPPKGLVRKLVNLGQNRLYIDGGITIKSFLEEELMDEMTISTVPILLGRGKALFGSLKKDIYLELAESKSYEFGLVQSKYRVLKYNPTM